MKKFFSNIRTMAALLMAGAAFAACSSSDDIIENQQPANNGKQAYTLTINASKDGAATRALTVDNGAIVASWATTDVIYVTKGTTAIGTLSPTSINGLEATFTGTISGDAQINESDVLTLTYHPIASLSAFASQNGTLNGSATSAENFDMAIATVHISEINGNTITVSEESANFVNQTAVVVLSPYNSSWSEYHSLSSMTVSATITIPGVGAVTEKIGPISVTGDQPHYFALPSQDMLANYLAAKYSFSASTFTTLLASATITFTGHQTDDDYDREYLTCSKTGYKFAAGKYYKLDNSNFSMTMLYKRAVADKDVYVESQDVSWSHTVTFAVNKEIGWKVVGDYVFCGDKQLYVVDNSGPEPSEGWVKASDDHIPFDATYSLVTPAKAAADATAEDKGKLIGTDGNIYANVAAAEAAGTTAVAMIAYVGSETGVAGYTHGLALALTDEGLMFWQAAIDACSAKNTSTTVTDATWLLASKEQWNYMLGTNGAGSYTALRDGFSGISGASSLQSSYPYWSSTAISSTEMEDNSEYAWYDYAWYYYFGDRGDGHGWYTGLKGHDEFGVRACLAF